MRQRTKPPTGDIEWAHRAGLESMGSMPGDSEQPATVPIVRGFVGWLRLPPTITVSEAGIVPYVWLSQGRSMPEA
jgi:hypothetical protein